MNTRDELAIRVLLADDDPFMLEGARSCLSRCKQFNIVGGAHDGQDAIRLAKCLAPDVVVMAFAMSVMNGLEATRRLQSVCPQAKVVLLTDQESPEFIYQLIQSGARGYVHKSSPPAELISAIQCVHRGELFFKPEVAQSFFKQFVLKAATPGEPSPKPLSKREHEALSLVVEGLANNEIANRLLIREGTVEKHRESIMKKLGIHKATELVRFALARGLVQLNAP